MSITKMLLAAGMQFPETSEDLRSNEKEGHWHETEQFHQENKHLLEDYVDCRRSQTAN